ncbi:MAG: hypothetical protein L6V90_10015 [Treponema succinifaciens]|nr:MAG: hypothetical protein L6V90_10015 [Treponema succinifaciens]
MANLTITLDDQDKKDISSFCEQVGMTVSGLYNVYKTSSPRRTDSVRRSR